MAKTKISEFSSTAGNNTDIDSINIAEGCAPSGINNAIRELMAQLKDFQTGAAGDSFNGPVGTTTAAAGAFTNLTASGTLDVTGVATFTAKPVLSSLTASQAVFSDGSKGLVSNAITGTGNVVMSTSPTLVTPVLGTPASVTLTNGTGLPVSTGISGLGTGVATALAVNVGSAGAPVVNGGALGTPSSGTVTNLTGTASININGTVGATTANTGAFTTLTTSSTVTHNGGTANGVAYLNGSKVLTTGSALWFDGTNFGVGTGGNTLNHQSVVYKVGANAVYQQVANGSTGLGATNGIRLGVSNGGTGELYSPTALISYIDNTEQMRLTSTGLELKGKLAAGYTDFSGIPTNGAAFSGSVGIGTSSPGMKLDVAGGDIRITSASAPSLYVNNTSASGKNYRLISADSGNLIIQNTGIADLVYLNTAGNLGLGVTPSAWGSGYKAIQLLTSSLYGTTSRDMNLGANVYVDAVGYKYIETSFATNYTQYQGAHSWYTAPSGTAGDAISFTQAMTLSASGSLGIGTTSPSTRLSLGGDTGQKLSVYDTGGVRSGFGVDMGGSSYELSIFAGYNGGNGQITFGGLDTATNTYTERARITSGGDLLVGTTSSTPDLSNVAGAVLGATGTVVGSRSDGPGAAFNRKTNDGTIVSLRQDGTEEGNISVSGTTVSYNGGHLSRWAQMLAKPELFKGTVMSNLDEMNVYTDADGNPVENEQLNKVKVSDVEGDANVAGVFVNWTYDDAHNVDEINMAMTGDMIIRIAQGVIVQRGDLLMSAGDGTAKPQGDDIVRSKTVAKVTSTHVTCTYADGSFCVPCVLMAC